MILAYSGTNVCVCRDTTPTLNHSSSISIGKPFTKLSHRRARPSIDKSLVSKPFPILAFDDRELFETMASGNLEARDRRIPKAAERKVSLVTPESITPRTNSRVPADSSPSSRSWYTPARVNPPLKGSPQRSFSNATPQSTRPKVDVMRANSTKGFSNHGPTFSAKSADDTLRPTVRLISKPLPDLPIPDSRSSKWSDSTGSVYSDGTSFSVLRLFPHPPDEKADFPTDWENCISLSTPPVFMSYDNTSSSSVATVLGMTSRDSPTLKLKVVPKPKVATIVQQNPRASLSFSQLPDSIDVHRGRGHHKAPTKGTTRLPHAQTLLRNRSISLSSSNPRNPPGRVANVEALVFPHLRQSPEELARFEQARMERYRQYDREQEKRQEMDLFSTEFGLNPWYKGRKQVVDPYAFELVKPEKKQKKWF